ncbi:hypothetical protein L7F22_045650 [Adiantum nelumboides]|nr:hypothetical protein [Adiantum nelumboides]
MVVSRDDKFDLHTEDFNGVPLVRMWCHECGVLYGKGSIERNQVAYNCCSNFMQTHILEIIRHEMKYMVAQGLQKEDMPKVVNQPQKDDKKDIEAALEKLRSLMATNDGWDFEVVEATLHDFKDKRDFYPGLKCPLHLLGFDVAKIFFSKIGSMVGQERSYDLMDMLRTIGILNRLAHFECKEDGPLFARAHKKQEHVWSELNHNESMAKSNLGDYDCVSIDEKIINALKKGFESAFAICKSFHMKPKDKDKEKM